MASSSDLTFHSQKPAINSLVSANGPSMTTFSSPEKRTLTPLELGKLCVAELIQRTNLDGKEVQALVYGTVVADPLTMNTARELSLMQMLPKVVHAVTVSRACTSANQAITDAADQIALGHGEVEDVAGHPLPHGGKGVAGDLGGK